MGAGAVTPPSPTPTWCWASSIRAATSGVENPAGRGGGRGRGGSNRACAGCRPGGGGGGHLSRRQHQHGGGNPPGLGPPGRGSAALRPPVFRRSGRATHHRRGAHARGHPGDRPAGGVSALGLGTLATDLRYEMVRTHVGEAREIGSDRLRQRFSELEEEGRRRLGSFAGEIAVRRSADMRYGEQTFEISVPLDGVDMDAADLMDQVVARFHARHEALYTHSAPGQEVVLVNARLAVVGRLPASPGPRPRRPPRLPRSPPASAAPISDAGWRCRSMRWTGCVPRPGDQGSGHLRVGHHHRGDPRRRAGCPSPPRAGSTSRSDRPAESGALQDFRIHTAVSWNTAPPCGEAGLAAGERVDAQATLEVLVRPDPLHHHHPLLLALTRHRVHHHLALLVAEGQPIPLRRGPGLHNRPG